MAPKAENSVYLALHRKHLPTPGLEVNWILSRCQESQGYGHKFEGNVVNMDVTVCICGDRSGEGKFPPDILSCSDTCIEEEELELTRMGGQSRQIQ